METKEKAIISVSAKINVPIDLVWKCWTTPEDIIRWNCASDDWHTPRAENDLRVGGSFFSRMEAKDGSMGFDFTGEYSKVEPHKQIEYTMDDGRIAQVTFHSLGSETTVTENFEAEHTNSIELQKTGWQAILENFKKYAESLVELERLHFEISINAKTKKVYETMLDEKHFAEWTSVFNPNSQFKGSWEKGSKILFLGIDTDGSIGGMVARIKENIPNKFVSIKYFGVIQNNKEIISGPEIEGWTGALENYSFTEMNGKTLLAVDLDSNLEFMAYFKDTWPKALNKLKDICEE